MLRELNTTMTDNIKRLLGNVSSEEFAEFLSLMSKDELVEVQMGIYDLKSFLNSVYNLKDEKLKLIVIETIVQLSKKINKRYVPINKALLNIAKRIVNQ